MIERCLRNIHRIIHLWTMKDSLHVQIQVREHFLLIYEREEA